MAAFASTITKPHVNLNPFCPLTLGLEQRHPVTPQREPHVTCGVKYNWLAVSVRIPATVQHLASFYDVVLGSVCFWSSHQKRYPAVKRNKTKGLTPKAQVLSLYDIRGANEAKALPIQVRIWLELLWVSEKFVLGFRPWVPLFCR